MKIKKDEIIHDVISRHPEVMEVFFDYGISCVGCVNSYMETIEEGAKLHGISLDELLEDLNEFIE